MLNHIRTYRMIPVGKLAAWEAATGVTEDPNGLGATTALYAISEPVPRSNVTHRGAAGVTAQEQLDLMNNWGFDANGYLIPPTGLEGCIVKIRVLRSAPGVSDPDPYPGMLSDNSLTPHWEV